MSFPFQFPDALCMVYFTYTYMVNVGKYIEYMEPLGLGGVFRFKFVGFSGLESSKPGHAECR